MIIILIDPISSFKKNRTFTTNGKVKPGGACKL